MLAAWVCDHGERAQSLNVIAEHKLNFIALYLRAWVSFEFFKFYMHKNVFKTLPINKTKKIYM